jgi:hypothetical protein
LALCVPEVSMRDFVLSAQPRPVITSAAKPWLLWSA